MDLLAKEMDIGLIIHKNIKVFSWIVLILQLLEVSGFVVKRQLLPSFLPTDTDIVVHRGETAVLRCVVKNIGPRSVSWRKVSEDFPLTIGGMMYAPNEEMSVDFQENGRTTNNTLIIKHAHPRHSGTYECQISSSDIYTYHVHLTVLKQIRYREPSIALDGTLYPSPRQKLNLTCNATGAVRAPEKIDWFHNGNLIEERKEQWANRVVIVNFVPEVPGVSLLSQLTIDSVSAVDAGVYVCRSLMPNFESKVMTTSVMVNVLNAEKDIKKREDGHTQNSSPSHKRTQEDTNKSATLSCGYYMYIVAITVLCLLRR